MAGIGSQIRRLFVAALEAVLSAPSVPGLDDVDASRARTPSLQGQAHEPSPSTTDSHQWCRGSLLVAVAALVLFAPMSAVAQSTESDDDAGNRPDPIWIQGDQDPNAPADEPLRTSTIANLVDDVSPAVVNIVVAYEGKELESILKKEKPLPGPDGGIGQGSGFLIHPDGYVLTNYHVVENAHEIKVRLRDDTEHQADVVGVDPKMDIALLQIRSDRTFPALPLGDSDRIEVGDHVVAIGNPLGLEHTVTSGIVSALGRHNLGLHGGSLYTDFIQIDVSINPGNSGGPLVGLAGEVVGINTAINRKGQGIGFSIPINMVKTLLPQLKKKGYVTRSWLGARVQAVTPALAESFQLDDARGALVAEVVEESPAQRAGLQAGDVIVKFDGKEIRSSNQLPWMVSTTAPDNTVELEYYRTGKRQSMQVTLAKHPEQSTPELPQSKSSSSKSNASGLQVKVKDLTESLARQLGAGSRSGVVVTKVGEDSPAKGAGLRRRDVITEIEGTSVDSKSDFQSVLDGLEIGDVVRLKLIRGGRVVFIAFER